ncbi:MAG: SPASM domain-containing protein [Schwartzia sp.]|nr:SPASM domain-containing protein [Schwartzia sp. (in: firmicutes)]
MEVQELAAAKFLEHLRRHPLPELMDDVCVAALSAVERQYGDTITHGAGLEVRLGDEEKYVDYIMNIDEDGMPPIASLWYEIDYAEYKDSFQSKREILPCLFANISEHVENGDYDALWDKVLQPFLGEKRAEKLRAPLDRVTAALPKDATIKQIGTMSSRGELDIMRLVILFPSWESIFPGLRAFGWPGDADALKAAMEPWKENRNIAVNLDLGESGVLPKIGIEVFSRWRHPLLVDKFIARLEGAGLCLPSKGAALRRWIRIRPDGDPFIQTLIAYFKLNYKDGKITEAKAYLEQSPYIHHHYFDAYHHPVYVEMELKSATHTLPVGDALQWIFSCEMNGVREVRFVGDAAGYEHLDRLLGECANSGMRSAVLLSGKEDAARLKKILLAGADALILELDDDGLAAMKILPNVERPLAVRAVWRASKLRCDGLPEAVAQAEAAGATELVVAAPAPGAANRELPDRLQMESLADFIRAYEKNHGEAETGAQTIKLSVDSCFSQLRAFLGGDDPTKNGNRGLGRGCTAGRDHFCILASGLATPCTFLDMAAETHSLADYWEHSPRLAELRRKGEPDGERCANCRYARRCLPCPAANPIACPV